MSEKTREEKEKAAKFLAGACALVVIAWFFFGGGQNTVSSLSNDAHGSSCHVDYAHYAKLRNGMTYNQTIDILGCDGREISSTDLAGYKTVMYGWDGLGSVGANLSVMFQNDRLNNKSQFGLK